MPLNDTLSSPFLESSHQDSRSISLVSNHWYGRKNNNLHDPIMWAISTDNMTIMCIIIIIVRCENWVNPQDRFLLQSVALEEDESQHIDAVTVSPLSILLVVILVPFSYGCTIL